MLTAMGGVSFSFGVIFAAFDIQNINYAAVAYGIGMVSMMLIALALSLRRS